MSARNHYDQIPGLVVDSASAPDTDKIHTDITDHNQKLLLTFKFYKYDI